MYTGQNGKDKGGKRVCLLTGASGTLGFAFCRQYARRYDIAAIYRNQIPMVPSQEQWLVDPLDPGAPLPENDHPVFALRADLTNDAEMDAALDQVLDRFGRIDVLINAAAYWVLGPIVESDPLLDSAVHQFYLNTIVPLKLASRIARRFWKDRDRENIRWNRNVINVSSLSGMQVYARQGQSVYSASKAALNQLTLHMAHEFKSFGVRVNAAAPNSFPGHVATERVAKSLLYLDRAKFTGKLLIVDKLAETV